MRVLHLITGLEAGGAERVTVDLAIAQAGHGHTVEIASMIGRGHFSDLLADAGLTVHDLGFSRGRFPLNAFIRTVRLIRRTKPDVLHTTMLHANLLGRVARTLTPLALLVSTVQNVDERGNATRSLRRARSREQLYRLTDRMADVTSHVSESGATDYVQRRLVSHGRMVFVPNGTDTTRFQPGLGSRDAIRSELRIPDGSHVFLNVGSMHAQKAQAELIRAFAEAFRGGTETLVILGDGPLRHSIEQAIESESIGAQVRLLGIRRDVPDVLASADTFVLPSNFEGMPLALLEAMAAGLPAICTDVGANGLVATHDLTGLIIPPSDRTALTNALVAMNDMPAARRASMGEQARRRVVEHFSVDEIARRWLAFYEMAVRERSPARFGRPGAHLLGDVPRHEGRPRTTRSSRLAASDEDAATADMD